MIMLYHKRTVYRHLRQGSLWKLKLILPHNKLPHPTNHAIRCQLLPVPNASNEWLASYLYRLHQKSCNSILILGLLFSAIDGGNYSRRSHGNFLQFHRAQCWGLTSFGCGKSLRETRKSRAFLRAKFDAEIGLIQGKSVLLFPFAAKLG